MRTLLALILSVAACVAAPMGFNRPQVMSGLVCWLTFNEGTGTNAFDQSGCGNHGVFTNSPTWVPGQVGAALKVINGSGVVCPNSASLNIAAGGAVTMCAWVYRTNFVSYGQIIAKRGLANYPYAMDISQSQIRVYTEGSSSVGYFNWQMPNNEWVHFVATMSSGPTQLYTNGVLFGTSGSGGGVSSSTTSALWIGRDAPGNNFTGQIDDVRIYNRALSADEVRQIYRGGYGSQ